MQKLLYEVTTRLKLRPGEKDPRSLVVKKSLDYPII